MTAHHRWSSHRWVWVYGLSLLVAVGMAWTWPGPTHADGAAPSADDTTADPPAAAGDGPAAGQQDTAGKDSAGSDTRDSDQDAAPEASQADDEAPAAQQADDESDESTDQQQPSPSAKRQAGKVRLAEFVIKDSLPESAGQPGPFGDLQLDLRETIQRIDKAAEDTSIAGAILNVRNPEIGRAKIFELRDAIARFRAKGKKIYAQLESANPSDYLIACACDEIVMPESGIIMLPGVHAEATFFKGLLGKVGVRADFIHIGDFKAAAEPLTREEFSKPVRENVNALVDGMYDEMVTTIVKDRPLSVAQAREVIDLGLLTASRAKELGLIDRIAYPDVLRDELGQTYHAQPLVYVRHYGQKKVDTDFSGPMGMVKLMHMMLGGESATAGTSGKKIAVVYAVGPIATGKSQSDPFGGEVMGAASIVEALRKSNDDQQVAAIVLRIDSPGGSALASDLIWRETQVIDKPIVASMGDVAASGGYYVAMGADKIVAAPGTITGSIGVVGGKLVVRGLYDKLGISTEIIERGRNSGLFSSSGEFTDSQREVVLDMMQDVYRQFTTKAAAGRKMPVEQLRQLAGGRVYTGRQALSNGLVDKLGTLHDAIQEAKQLAGLDRDTKVRLEILPQPSSFFETLFGGAESEREVRWGKIVEPLAPELVELARRAHRIRAVFDRPAALLMPFELEVR